MLREAGLPVVHSQAVDYLRALTHIDLAHREQLFYAARCLLVTRAADLPVFSAVFERFWRLHRGLVSIERPPRRRPPRPGELVARLFTGAASAQAPEEEVELEDRRATASDLEVLRRKDLGRLTEAELEEVRRLMRRMRWAVSERRSLRFVADRRGRRLDLRAILREAGRQGGTALRLHHRSRKIKPRPLVVLADISGSMERYSRILLQFLYCLTHGLELVECFAFGTRLTHLTPLLAARNLDRALEQASREVVDWAGGTRIGESLASFNRRWSRRVLHRGAVAIIISDGWERGDPSLLYREMCFLRHRCHRLIWLNPLLGERDYQPLVEGMATALPLVDDFLPVHNLHSLGELAEHLRALPGRRSSRGTNPRRASLRRGTA